MIEHSPTQSLSHEIETEARKLFADPTPNERWVKDDFQRIWLMIISQKCYETDIPFDQNLKNRAAAVWDSLEFFIGKNIIVEYSILFTGEESGSLEDFRKKLLDLDGFTYYRNTIDSQGLERSKIYMGINDLRPDTFIREMQALIQMKVLSPSTSETNTVTSIDDTDRKLSFSNRYLLASFIVVCSVFFLQTEGVASHELWINILTLVPMILGLLSLLNSFEQKTAELDSFSTDEFDSE